MHKNKRAARPVPSHCLRLSVRPDSVTFVYSVETNKHIFVMAIFRRGRNPLTRVSNAGGVGKNRDSRSVSCFIACCQRFDRQVYSLHTCDHRCLLGKAPVYLSNCCVLVSQVATSWPYLDIVSALTVGGHLLSLVRRCLTLCQMIYEILQSALQPSDSHWRLIFYLPVSMFSALEVSHVMRSINARYLLTYLHSCGGPWQVGDTHRW